MIINWPIFYTLIKNALDNQMANDWLLDICRHWSATLEYSKANKLMNLLPFSPNIWIVELIYMEISCEVSANKISYFRSFKVIIEDTPVKLVLNSLRSKINLYLRGMYWELT